MRVLYFVVASIFFVVISAYNYLNEDTKHVVFIGVDAMSPDGIRNAHTPVLDSLMANGTYTLSARGVLPSVSSVNWFGMISGATPEQSGVTGNAWRVDNHVLPATYHGAEGMFPTILSVVRDAMPDAEIGVVYHWEGFNNLFERSIPNYDATFPTEEETAMRTAEYIQQYKPNFTFVNIDHVDIVGHKDGHGTPAFYASVSKADSLIGVIIDGIRQAGMIKETTIIIVADHGGIKYGHGGETIGEMEIPIIVAGRGVKRGVRIERPVSLLDAPATALHALGIETPIFWTGRPILEAFIGEPMPTVEFNNLLAIPSAMPARGAFTGLSAPIELSTLTANAQIRYTTDGSEPTVLSNLYNEPIVLSESATIKAKTFRDDESGRTAEYTYCIVEDDSNHGVAVKYLSFMDSYSKGGITEGINLVSQKEDTIHQISLHSLEMGENPAYVLEFTSNLFVEDAGDYTLYIASANPTILFVNGQEVIKNPGRYNTREEQATVTLAEGYNTLRLMYYSLIYGKTLKLEYSSSSIPRMEVPATKLFVAK